METEFKLLCLWVVMFLIWNITLISVDNKYDLQIRGHTSVNVIQQFARLQGIADEKVVLYKYDGHVRKYSSDILLSGGRWSIGARPVSGDHIHAAISFWIGDVPRLFAEHDRHPMDPIPYETKKPSMCLAPDKNAYTKLWPHVGVHTHCDGLIHVHPWSAPKSIRKEGLDVQLGLWFDQVGIQYRESPFVSLEFADGLRLDGNATHRWYVAEKKCFNDSDAKIYSEYLDQIWLGHAYGSYVFWYGKIGSESPGDIESHIDSLKSVGVYSFNEYPYPQDCL
jgi:hypothetical protein